MHIRKSLIHVLAVAAIVPLMMTIPSSAPRAVADTLIPTHLYIHSIGSDPITYGRTIYLRGQVFYTDPDDGGHYAAEGSVTLERRNAAGTTWATLGSDEMSVFYPVFSFTTTAWKNAEYRLTFAESERYEASTDSLTVRVARDVSAKLTEPRENVFFLSGQVRPAYAGRSVTLMRRTCSSCAWRSYVSQATSSTSRYRFKLPLPKSGAYYFKARVVGDADFVTSYSSSYQLLRLF